MKTIIFIILCNISLLSIGQYSVCFSELHVKFHSIDNKLFIRKGNMVSMDSSITKKIILDKFEEFYIDKLGIRSFYFLDSAANIHGWLVEDKSRHKTLYFDRELILVKNNNNDKIIFEITKKCGFDIFTYKKCGFLDACYDFNKGILFFYKTNIPFRMKRKMMLNISTGKLKKCK